MSGHNRWSKLKRRKAVEGVAKGKLYTKLIKELTVAARLGGGDASGNARLRTAMATAREANMPADIIQRAIKKGTGELEGVSYEEALYEGYGPGGVAVLIECLTDNKNRTNNDLRMALARGGGNLGASGAVAWMFQKKGLIWVRPGPSEDQVLEKALEAGAEDLIALGDEGFEVRTEPSLLHQVALGLEKEGLQVREQKWSFLPTNTVRLEGENAQKMLRLLEAIEDNDDVQNVYANFEIDEALMAAS